ncbi:integral membrane sensor signal transduction histidine kinase [Thiorhodococcus drewsii AZ1]|uniref:histidine kinase n=1 Tax=Thiorhodococcus drewsii AZ1 TaxID=765913 RepID=G2E3T2_9GAMM|nr:ATP-binding protein [Thiorhodococcus drewsii]EGV30024.1 integral membrane sensor signal transduction histidine kinase [Thiorhodococcus drewsii AZ1]
MMSLRTRVALSGAVVLTVFVLFTSLALERAVRDTVLSAREERLLAQVFLLMAAGEEEPGGLVFPKTLGEPRLNLPDSGLYAKVLNALGDPIWQSPSAIGADCPTPLPLAPGQRRFERLSGSDGSTYLTLAFGVTWATGPTPQDYTFVVAEDAAAFHAEVGQFRASLAVWLGGMSVLMLVILVAILRWGLKPLRRVAEEVAAIESGKQAQIQGRYPAEIRALTGNLNALLAHERARQRRLDNTLGDLAHSLKTPLAVMRGALEEGQVPSPTGKTLQEQLGRMGHIVEYQLQRARAGGQQAATLAPPVPIRRTAERLVATLTKVYRDAGIQVTLEMDQGIQFQGVEGDLLEMLGNLLENAFKWGKRRIRVWGTRSRGRLLLVVEDDGPGIAPEQASRLLERGARADEATPGHGIGLAVVREISDAYGGTLRIDQSPLGGARFRLSLPA